MKKILSTTPIAQAQIDAWKNESPTGVFAISVPSTDAEDSVHITGYFRKPSIDEIGLATSGNDKTPLKATMVMYNTCLLGGHPEFDTNEDVKRAALSQFKDVLKTRTATITKL